jgi:hypothetical protein
MQLLDPDVVLSDYALTGLSFFLSSKMKGLKKDTQSLFFLFSGLSSFFGGTYHGFFPNKTQTFLGKAIWVVTLLCLAIAANCLWAHLLKRQSFPGRQKSFWILFFLTLAFGLHAFFMDHRFFWGILYYAFPLLVLAVQQLADYVRLRKVQSRMGLMAIGGLFIASILQQLKIGIHPHYFDHNALYHLVSFVSLILFYEFFRREDLC